MSSYTRTFFFCDTCYIEVEGEGRSAEELPTGWSEHEDTELCPAIDSASTEAHHCPDCIDRKKCKDENNR